MDRLMKWYTAGRTCSSALSMMEAKFKKMVVLRLTETAMAVLYGALLSFTAVQCPEGSAQSQTQLQSSPHCRCLDLQMQSIAIDDLQLKIRL